MIPAPLIGVTAVTVFAFYFGLPVLYVEVPDNLWNSVRLPSLNVLDEMNLRAVKIGWLFLTVGLITGGIWASQLQPSPDRVGGSMSLGDPKIFVAVLCWAVYSFELYAQRAIGWRGRRAAWLSAVGFGIVLLNFVPVSYFFTTSHNF